MTWRFKSGGAAVVVVCVCACAIIYACGADNAAALPEGRHYEMVSPPYKGGYGVEVVVGVLPSGNTVAYKSRGAFAGNPRDFLVSFYLAGRQEGGWSSIPLEPPTKVDVGGNEVELSGNHLDLSSNGTALWVGCPAPNEGVGTSECAEMMLLKWDPQVADWGIVSPPLRLLEGEPPNESFDIGYQSGSPDLCTVVLTPAGEGPMTAEAKGTEAELYEVTTGCGGEPPALRLVGVNNKDRVIDPYCQERLGGWGPEPEHEGREGAGNQFNAVAADGQETFFTAFVEPNDGAAHCGGSDFSSPANPSQLFVRLNGSRTVEVSRPLEAAKPFGGCKRAGVGGEVPCEGASKRAPAVFVGASEDGSKAFFTTSAPLTAEGDESNNLYMADIGCPPAEEECEVAHKQVISLVRVSRPQPTGGEEAEVAGVVKVAPDGSHVYFVAQGVLSGGPGPQGRMATKGADNLYVYDTASGAIAFVTELCSGAGVSGSISDERCPGGSDAQLWGFRDEGNEAQVNTCGSASSVECTGERETGRFLAFSTFGQLPGLGAQVDTDNARDVYRYDDQTGALERVSVGERGADALGNCEDAPGGTRCDALIVPSGLVQSLDAVYAQQEMGDRSISEDGSRIVFTTAAPLSSAASNGLPNVYEWLKRPGATEGSVSVVSTGSSTSADTQPMITPSGRDVFFLSSQGMLPQDGDGQVDVYDAREGHGFPPAPVEAEQCSADACLGALMSPAPQLVPGSVLQAPGQNVPAPKAAVAKAVKKKRKPKRMKKRRMRGKKARR